MRALSATDLAIGIAIQQGTISLVERPSRLGGTYIAIEDDRGLIEVALARAEAEARLASVKGRLA